MKLILLVCAFSFALSSHALAETKELKTEKNKSIAVLNLVNVAAKCQSGPVVIPEIKKKPENGVLMMQPRVVDIPAKGSCLAQKVPAVTIVYIPRNGFAGVDAVKIDIEVGEKRRELEYKISVNDAGQGI